MATLSRWHSGFEVGKVSAAEYDLVVVGSGPAGQKGAIAAAKAHKRVALIDRTGMLAALDGAE
jgi:NAD(P) transhydrogenase